MRFNKKILSKEGIQKVVKTADNDLFLQYFKADGISFDDMYSHNIYLQLKEVKRIKNKSEREEAITSLVNSVRINN